MTEQTLTVELTVRETRALAAAANFATVLLGPMSSELFPEDDLGPRPAETAAMKLEVALMSAGAIER